MSQTREPEHSDPASEEQQAGRRMLAVTEEELCRIILDIHDGPVQNLFAALSEVNLAQRRLEKATGSEQEALTIALGRVASLLEESLREIRTFLGAFRPPEFRERDLLSVLEQVIIQHEEWTGNHVDLKVKGEMLAVDLPTKIALYRILQEALSNAYRHAGVDRYRVRLGADGDWISLEVADDGAGFEPPPLAGPTATDKEEHIGLRGMRDRVAMLGGNLELYSRPGHGTRITAKVPSHV